MHQGLRTVMSSPHRHPTAVHDGSHIVRVAPLNPKESLGLAQMILRPIDGHPGKFLQLFQRVDCELLFVAENTLNPSPST